ncbi:hypothetical protein BT93_L3898 [Corymbia citriodora subsp. variegata]|uniref:Uncharacterized protein n=1 Tax=Corymbia citriodora subsp. variegata TaxID=360336 RepID=A0A8T0CIR8_CORYI|nr:hypothetical protein BT93_L3898 [Corymbia citriodora subsp. variegata]
MESIALWQAGALCGIVCWILVSSYCNVTGALRSLLQPWVAHHVVVGIPLILQIQSGHGKLARQMTLLMAFCDYMGNCVKDVVSAPRPTCPPVRRVTATKDEEDNAMEYGFSSSHTLNTVCLSGYDIFISFHGLCFCAWDSFMIHSLTRSGQPSILSRS